MKTRLLLAFIASTALSASALAQSTGTTTDTGSSTGTGASSTTTTGTGDTTSGTTGTSGTSGTSTSTGANTGSGSTTGNSSATGAGSASDAGSASSTPGSQSPNPNVYGDSSGGQNDGGMQSGPWNQRGWGGGFNGGFNGGYGGAPMMQGMMTCVSPAPMGGFGSFACYPVGWGMGMGMNGMNGGMGWHPRHHGQWGNRGEGDYTPNDYYVDRQSYQGKRNRSRVPGYDNGSDSYDDGNSYDNDWRNNSGGSNSYGNDGSDDYSNSDVTGVASPPAAAAGGDRTFVWLLPANRAGCGPCGPPAAGANKKSCKIDRLKLF